MSAFTGVGLAAAIAARWGGWQVPVHCSNGAIVKLACTNGAVASVVVWLRGGCLVYAAKVARADKILADHQTSLLPVVNDTLAVDIYLTIRAVVGRCQAHEHAFESAALRWHPPFYALVTAAIAITTPRVDDTLTAVSMASRPSVSHSWVVFGASRHPTAIEITPSDVRVGQTIVAAFSPSTYNLNADVWRGQPDCATYVAHIAAALAAHFNT